MNAGRLDTLLVFETKTVTYVGEVRTETWAASSFSPLWTEPQKLSETAARFVIRYRPDFTSTIVPGSCRVLYLGARWNVTTAIPNIQDDSLTLESDFSEKIEVTHLQSGTKEYIDGLPIVHP